MFLLPDATPPATGGVRRGDGPRRARLEATLSRQATVDRLLRAVGYEPTAEVAQAVAFLLTPARRYGARALFVSGPAGAGKTALAEALARATRAPFFYALLHDWSGADDLFGGVDVAAAVAGAAEHVREHGVLRLAAEASHRNEFVVLCLDELDKAQEAVEGLLLDFLQSGRVPIRPGVHLQARLDRLAVVLTSNGARPHTEPLLRRCRRLRMRPLPAELMARLVEQRVGCPAGVATLAVRLAVAVALAEGRDADTSVQEVSEFVAELVALQTAGELCRPAVLAAACGWLARHAEGEAALRDDGGGTRRLVDALLGELRVAGRRV